MAKDRFSKWPLSKSPKSPETCFQSHYGPSQTSVAAYYALSRFVTHCWVHAVLLRPARFLISTVTAAANFDSLKIWHGNQGLQSVSIPAPCVATRPSRFLHGGLKRGRRSRREPSVNLA